MNNTSSNNMFFHKECGGEMHVDILKSFTWKTPSVVLTPDGLRLGVTEFRGTSGKKDGAAFSCSKCGEEVPLNQAGKCLELECSVCKEHFPVDKMMTCRQIQCVCETCQKVLTGKEEPTTPRQTELVKYLFLGKQKDITFTSVTTILSKSVMF